MTAHSPRDKSERVQKKGWPASLLRFLKTATGLPIAPCPPKRSESENARLPLIPGGDGEKEGGEEIWKHLS